MPDAILLTSRDHREAQSPGWKKDGAKNTNQTTNPKNRVSKAGACLDVELVWRLDVEGTWGRTWAEGAPEMGCLCWSLHVAGEHPRGARLLAVAICASAITPTAVLRPVSSGKPEVER